MTIVNNLDTDADSAKSRPENRISTRGGKAVTIAENQGTAWFIYNATNRCRALMGCN
jgi:hypothetical protein